jgi:hypothetical protein
MFESLYICGLVKAASITFNNTSIYKLNIAEFLRHFYPLTIGSNLRLHMLVCFRSVKQTTKGASTGVTPHQLRWVSGSPL